MDEDTREALIAGLRIYKAALKTVTAKVTALIDGVVTFSDDRVKDIQADFDTLTDARQKYDDAVAAAGFPRPIR